MAEKLADIYQPIWSFLRKHSEIPILPTAFTKTDVILLVHHGSDAFLLCLGSRPGLKSTMLENFGCRSFSAAEEKAKKMRNSFSDGKWYISMLFGFMPTE